MDGSHGPAGATAHDRRPRDADALAEVVAADDVVPDRGCLAFPIACASTAPTTPLVVLRVLFAVSALLRRCSIQPGADLRLPPLPRRLALHLLCLLLAFPLPFRLGLRPALAVGFLLLTLPLLLGLLLALLLGVAPSPQVAEAEGVLALLRHHFRTLGEVRVGEVREDAAEVLALVLHLIDAAERGWGLPVVPPVVDVRQGDQRDVLLFAHLPEHRGHKVCRVLEGVLRTHVLLQRFGVREVEVVWISRGVPVCSAEHDPVAQAEVVRVLTEILSLSPALLVVLVAKRR